MLNEEDHWKMWNYTGVDTMTMLRHNDRNNDWHNDYAQIKFRVH